MALFGVKSVTVGVLCLLSLASGQYQPNNPRQPCNDARVQSGQSLFSDPNYCQNFTQCDTAGNQWQKNCGGNLLFDANSGVCVHPEQARCLAWPCDASRVNIKYPGLCCKQFYNCNGAGFTEGSCPTGQVFNPSTGQCNAGVCSNSPGCVHPGTSNVDPPGWVCNLEATSNPCTYRTVIAPGVQPIDRPCGAGTAFNATACQCSIFNANCPGINNALTNTNPDGLCRASFRVEFDSFNSITGSPKAYSDKLGAQPVELPDQAQSVGVTYTNGRAYMAGNLLTGAQPSIYYPSFSNKQSVGNNVMRVVFGLTQAIAGQFEIISNNYNDACMPTLLMTGTYTGQTLTLTLFITGFTNTGINSQIVTNTTLTVNLIIGINDFCDLLITFLSDARVYFSAVNIGPNQNQNLNVVNSTVSGNIGSTLGYNTCGYVLAKNCRGCVIERIKIHENCIDVSKA